MLKEKCVAAVSEWCWSHLVLILLECWSEEGGTVRWVRVWCIIWWQHDTLQCLAIRLYPLTQSLARWAAGVWWPGPEWVQHHQVVTLPPQHWAQLVPQPPAIIPWRWCRRWPETMISTHLAPPLCTMLVTTVSNICNIWHWQLLHIDDDELVWCGVMTSAPEYKVCWCWLRVVTSDGVSWCVPPQSVLQCPLSCEPSSS